MKRLFALLTALLMLLPAPACASRTRNTGFTPDEAATVSARFDALLDKAVPGLPYPDCCQGMTQAERLLYVVIVYDSCMRSGGLYDFVTDHGDMLADAPDALALVGAREQRALLRTFLDAHDPDSWLIRAAGVVSRDLARSLLPFEDFDQQHIAFDEKTPLVSRTAAFITINEPLWRDSFTPGLSLDENFFIALCERMPDVPYPACADGLNADERALYVASWFLVTISGGETAFAVFNHNDAFLADVPAALRHVGADAYADTLEVFCAAGPDPRDPEAMKTWRDLAVSALAHEEEAQAAFAQVDAAFAALMAEMPLDDILCDFVVSHADSWR